MQSTLRGDWQEKSEITNKYKFICSHLKPDFKFIKYILVTAIWLMSIDKTRTRDFFHY